MFSFFKFLKLAITIISVALTVVVEIKKAMDVHFAGGQTA